MTWQVFVGIALIVLSVLGLKWVAVWRFVTVFSRADLALKDLTTTVNNECYAGKGIDNPAVWAALDKVGAELGFDRFFGFRGHARSRALSGRDDATP